jgi:hypothetical protein
MNRLVHHTKRVFRITGGFLLLLIGLIMMIPGIPGPGFLLILAGLSILAVDYVWAHRLNTYLKGNASKAMGKVRSWWAKEPPAGKT